MNLRFIKRVLTALMSLVAIVGVVYLFFFADMNHYVMDFMTSQGFHPDPNSKEFTIFDGVFRLALNFGFIGVMLMVPIIAASFLFMAITDTTFADLKKQKSASVETPN